MNVGDHVYCVDPQLDQRALELGLKPLHYKAYTIRDIEPYGDKVGYRLEELDNTDSLFYEEYGVEPTYNHKRFVPMEFDDLEFEMISTLSEEPALIDDFKKLTEAINDRYNTNYEVEAVMYQYYMNTNHFDEVNSKFSHNPYIPTDETDKY